MSGSLNSKDKSGPGAEPRWESGERKSRLKCLGIQFWHSSFLFYFFGGGISEILGELPPREAVKNNNCYDVKTGVDILTNIYTCNVAVLILTREA